MEYINFNYMSEGLFLPPRESNPKNDPFYISDLIDGISCDFLSNLKSISIGNLNSYINKIVKD